MRKLIILFLPIILFVYSTAKSDIVVSNWDGYSPADIMDTFKEATGISGEMALHATNEEIMGKVVASKGAGSTRKDRTRPSNSVVRHSCHTHLQQGIYRAEWGRLLGV